MVWNERNAALDTVRREAEARVREECAQAVIDMGPGHPTGAGDYDDWSIQDVAAAIRAGGET